MFCMASSVDSAGVVTVFLATLAEVEMKQERAAFLMGISRIQLHQQLNGQGQLSLFRISEMRRAEDGQAFLERFMPRLSVLWGVREWDGVVTGLMALTDAVTSGMHMARAQLRPAREEKRTA